MRKFLAVKKLAHKMASLENCEDFFSFNWRTRDIGTFDVDFDVGSALSFLIGRYKSVEALI